MRALTTAERQAIYRERMRKKGYIQTTCWIPKRDRVVLKNFLKILRYQFEHEKE